MMPIDGWETLGRRSQEMGKQHAPRFLEIVETSRKKVVECTVDDIKARLDKGDVFHLVDVREDREWDAGHLRAAKFVPMSRVKSAQLTSEMKKHLPKDKPIYCHCRSGGRVLTVSKLLRAQGYDIRPLKDGYKNLLEAGFEKALPEKRN